MERLRPRASKGRRPGSGQGLGPVFLWLTVAVLVPAACVLWFMGEAMRNERLAVRQKLEAVYRTQLQGMDRALGRALEARFTSFQDEARTEGAGRAFHAAVEDGRVSTLVFFDEQGRLAYPRPPRSSSAASSPSKEPSAKSSSYLEALERAAILGSRQPDAALDAYAEIAHDAPADFAARAWQARARLLLRSGRRDEALEVLLGPLSSKEMRPALDDDGRSIVASAALLTVRLLKENDDERFTDRLDWLAGLLRDPAVDMPSSQRLFLMRQVRELRPEILLPTFEAEESAARLVESIELLDRSPGWRAAPLDGFWQWVSADGTVLAIFDGATLRRAVHELLPVEDLAPDSQLTILGPSEPLPRLASGEWSVEAPLRSVPDGWRLVLRLGDGDLLDATALRRVSFLRLIAFLGIALILVLALWIGRRIRTQVELTRLKNDLLSTVSHELRTPLASMRLLVDTLLDDELGETSMAEQREYLRLIASENARLSRLVENFLTFSRLEQGRFHLDRRRVDVAEVVDAAVVALGEKLRSEACELQTSIADDLPPIDADPDALAMVLINLLDNACKYSGDDRRILLSARRVGDGVELAVEDHGIGIEPREVGRLFERFYQVDQRLSRRGEGCGLGLAIVRRIVEAHGGRVDVTSRPGEGSTFTVWLPTST